MPTLIQTGVVNFCVLCPHLRGNMLVRSHRSSFSLGRNSEQYRKNYRNSHTGHWRVALPMSRVSPPASIRSPYLKLIREYESKSCEIKWYVCIKIERCSWTTVEKSHEKVESAPHNSTKTPISTTRNNGFAQTIGTYLGDIVPATSTHDVFRVMGVMTIVVWGFIA